RSTCCASDLPRAISFSSEYQLTLPLTFRSPMASGSAFLSSPAKTVNGTASSNVSTRLTEDLRETSRRILLLRPTTKQPSVAIAVCYQYRAKLHADEQIPKPPRPGVTEGSIGVTYARNNGLRKSGRRTGGDCFSGGE